MGRTPANKRILLVEDEEILRFTFKSFLEADGCEVAEAADYESAMSLLENFRPSVIISDIILGGRTGIDLLRQSVRALPLTPFVIVTGKPTLESSTEALRLGAFDYLMKPVSKLTLLKVTSQALRHAEILMEKNAAEAGRESIRADLEAIFNSVNEGIITVDPALVVSRFNTAAERLLSAPEGSLAGKSLNALEGGFAAAAARLASKTISSGSPNREPAVERDSAVGKKRIASMNCSPLFRAGGDSDGAVIVITDITRESSLERELGRRSVFHGIVGASRAMQQVYSLIETLSGNDVTVLIEGESGTGKELAAEALHRGGIRAGGPLVKINCSALPETLLESELFGHVRGAFTGAVQDKTGRFQLADGGTIFLDEIGDVSPLVQLKLLRVLQEKEFERVGDSKSVKTDVRIITGTNRDLRELVRQGRFREDLFYRLNVVRLRIPPLRERIDDVPLLIEHFISLLNARFGRSVTGVSDEALRTLMRHTWPGNVRELEHALEHAFVLCRGNILTSDHLPAETAAPAAFSVARPQAALPAEDISTSDVTLDDIKAAIQKAGGNKAKAARLLGISRRTLYRRFDGAE